MNTENTTITPQGDWETEDLFDIGFTMNELEQLRKTISITLSKLEGKLKGTTTGTRAHRTALDSYRTLSGVYDTLQDAIMEGLGDG